MTLQNCRHKPAPIPVYAKGAEYRSFSYTLPSFCYCRALDKVELKVDENWLHQMRLVTSSPTRAARLLMNATTHRAAPAPAAEQRPLMTPRSLEAAEQNAAALKLTSHAVAAETEAADTIPAVHAVQEAVAVEVAAAPEAEPKQANKARSLVFRPMKKAAKMALSKKQAVVEVDVPFQLTSSAELEGPSSGALVAV